MFTPVHKAVRVELAQKVLQEIPKHKRPIFNFLFMDDDVLLL
jgi:hypothetical protein